MGAMGFALPAAIGAAATGKVLRTICVTGDGSLMTNLHELATLSKHRFNLKLFVINNDGYVSIRNTQKEFFNGNYVGAGPESGVFIPRIDALASAFSLPYIFCESSSDLVSGIRKALSVPGPVLCEIKAMSDQKIIPTVVSTRLPNGRMKSNPIENMFPYLADGVLQEEIDYARRL